MGETTPITGKLKNPMKPALGVPQETYRPHCRDCEDFGYIGDLKAVGDRNGATYVELQAAVDDLRVAFCGCASGSFQRKFLAGMKG